jgi:hypothetical protein
MDILKIIIACVNNIENDKKKSFGHNHNNHKVMIMKFRSHRLVL